MGRLMKIMSHVTLWTVRPDLGPYVCCETSDHMSGLEIVRLLQGFQGERHFSPLVLLFSKSTPNKR